MVPKKPHPVDSYVGKRLRLCRNMIGMSQEELGKSIGVTFQQVQKYERGTNRIGSSRLFQLAKVLDVPISYFFEEYDGAPSGFSLAERSPSATPSVQSNKDVARLTQMFSRIQNPDVRQKILSLVSSIVVAEEATNKMQQSPAKSKQESLDA